MQILSLIMGGIVFAMWAFSMFRTLFAMRRRAVERTGKSMPGPADTLREWGIWLRDPAFRQERRQLMFMTFCVLALAFLFALSAPGSSR